MTAGTTDESFLTKIPWDSNVFYVILASSLMGVMGVSLITPILPELRTVFAVSDAQIGLIITAYTLPGVFMAPFIGLIADRIGRRRVIIPLLLIFGTAGIGISFARTFTEVLALRFLQGVGASALVTLAVTLIGDFYDGVRQNTVMGVNSSMIGTGAAAYPLVGGALAGIRWNTPFLFFGVGIVVSVFALFTLPEPDGKQSTNIHTYLSQLYKVSVYPRALVLFGAIFIVFFIFYGAIQTAIPLLLNDEFALSSGEIGASLAIVSVGSAIVSSQYGRICQWRTAPELVTLGFIAYGLSLLGIWIASSSASVVLSLFMFGIGLGIAMPSIDTIVMDLVTNQFRAGIMGLRTSVLRLGQTLGPVSFTFFAETAFDSTSGGYRFLILILGSAILVSGVLAYSFLRR